jgi:hypothetical protein
MYDQEVELNISEHSMTVLICSGRNQYLKLLVCKQSLNVPAGALQQA